MSALHLELAFFKDDDLLCRGEVTCGATRAVNHLGGSGEHEFEVVSQFEEPASPVEIVCRHHGKHVYKAALRVGVHSSDAWESINLGNIHTLAFRCRQA